MRWQGSTIWCVLARMDTEGRATVVCGMQRWNIWIHAEYSSLFQKCQLSTNGCNCQIILTTMHGNVVITTDDVRHKQSLLGRVFFLTLTNTQPRTINSIATRKTLPSQSIVLQRPLTSTKVGHKWHKFRKILRTGTPYLDALPPFGT